MISIIPYITNKKDTWNNFNKDAKNGLFMFDRNYMDYHSDRFMDNSLMFYEDEKLIALLPCNVVENILYSHQGLTFGGFIVDENMKQGKMLECFEVLKEYMKENNFKKLIYKSTPYIYHKIPAQEDLYALFRSKAELFGWIVLLLLICKIFAKCQRGEKRKFQGQKEKVLKLLQVKILIFF